MSNLGECEVEWVLLSSPTFDQKNRVGSTNQRIADTLDWAEKWTTKMEEIKFNFIFWEEKKNIFSESADFRIAVHFRTWPTLQDEDQFTGLSDREAKMKGNKAQIKKDIERFNQQYSVGAVITNSANGVIYHAKRKSDGFTCVVKVTIPTIFE